MLFPFIIGGLFVTSLSLIKIGGQRKKPKISLKKENRRLRKENKKYLDLLTK